MKNQLILPTLIMALGLVLASFIAANTADGIFALKRTVTVKGLAEQQVEANVGVWNLPFYTAASSAATVRQQGEAEQKLLLDHFKMFGITEADLRALPMSIREERVNIGRDQWRLKYVLTGQVRVRTTDLDALDNAVNAADKLLVAGISLGRQYGDVPLPEYLFTELNAVKPSLIATATQNARAAAEQFAEDSGSDIGGIARANQGVVSILSRDGQRSQRNERYKTVRVVSTVDYFLEN